MKQTLQNFFKKNSDLILFISASVLVITAWNFFWFMTDDAYIAFRYIANRQAGFGYTWNAAPFLPVEGYTSFLWVFLLDGVWTLFKITPPESANFISLLFSLSALWICIKFYNDIFIKSNSDFKDIIFRSLYIIFIITNTTFLIWTSSGLETAMFNFFIILWLRYGYMIYKEFRKKYIFRLSLTCALLALTRPDGLLFAGATAAVIIWFIYLKKMKIRDLILALPFLLNIIHLLWRKSFYKEWLPNTYYAKYSSPWPEAGIKYLISFIMEYFLWIPILFSIIAIVIFSIKKIKNKTCIASDIKESIPLFFIISSSAVHILYYAIIIGGDHFEYRILSYTVFFFPLLLIRSVKVLDLNYLRKILVITLFIILSVNFSWSLYFKSSENKVRANTFMMQTDTAKSASVILKPYATLFDSLQSWLIKHFICIRYQEHKVYLKHFAKNLSEERHKAEHTLKIHKNPVIIATNVGIAGWIFRDTYMIDALGLNDYIIARNKPSRKNKNKLMAHNRVAPKGYLKDFMPDIVVDPDGKVMVFRRKHTLLKDQIRETEKKWRLWLKKIKSNNSLNTDSSTKKH